MIHALPRDGGFVGRREELSLLHDEFLRACEERARCVAVRGDAGIGKSRLVREFTGSLGDRATPLSGQCSEQIRSPYLPLASILAHLERQETGRAFEGRRQRAGMKEKASFFCRTAEMLERAARRNPLVAVVEDLQWADSATLELLAYLCQHLSAPRVLVLVTFRDDETMRNPSLSAFRYQAMRHRATMLQLHALRRNEVRNLVAQTLGRHGRSIAPETLSRIESLSEGNPLFAEELAHVASETGSLNLAAHMPLSIQAMLSERLVAFSDDERDLLVRAAIVGTRFDAAFLAKIAGASLETVLAVMQRAVRAGIAVESSARPDAFAFRHAMIREALADQLIVGLAAPLHVRIAEELQALGDANTQVAELAYHWSAARVADRARLYNERAAESAWNLYAYRDAIGFYSEALRWNYPAGAKRAAVYERLGTLLYIEGCGEEPAAWFDRCYDEHARLRDAAGMAHALLLLADQHWVDARTAESLRAAQSAAERIDAATDPMLAAEALLSLARFSVTLGDAERARDRLAAVTPLRRTFDTPLRTSFHEVGAEVHAALGQAPEAFAEARQAYRLAESTGSSELIAQVANNVAVVACDLGEIGVAIEHHEIAMAEARRTSMAWRVAYCALNYAHTLVLGGEFERARALVWEALEGGVTTATFKTKLAAVAIPLALALNDRRLLDACADEAAIDFAFRSGEIQRIGSVSAAVSALRVAQGGLDDARRLLATAAAAIPHLHRCWTFAVETALHGAPECVESVDRALRRSHGRPRVVRAYRLLFASLTSKAARPERSARIAGLAARAFARLGYRLYEALALETAGRTAEALVRYRAMGDVRAASRLQSERAAPPGPALPLSARQAEIARLVADGETNRAIAARLHISEHTVEHHISTIFARLGIRSRSQLAARVAAGE